MTNEWTLNKTWLHVNTLDYHVGHTFPVSTTYLISGKVSEVSATLVATTHSLQPSGGGENTCKIYERELLA